MDYQPPDSEVHLMEANKIIAMMSVLEKLICNTRHSWTTSGRCESVAGHSWRLPLEYDLNLTYGTEETAFSEYMQKLKKAINQAPDNRLNKDSKYPAIRTSPASPR